MDSNFEIPPVAHSRNNHCAALSSPHHKENPVAASLYRRTAPTVKPSKEKVTITIDSDREVSSTKKKSHSDIDNVPVSMSEEEEAQMESMMKRTLPQSREKCPACLLPSI